MEFIQNHYHIGEDGIIKVVSCDAVELGSKERPEYGPYSEDHGPPMWIIDGHDIYDLMTPSFFGQNVHLYYLVVGPHSIAVMIDHIPPEPSSDYTSLPRVSPAPEDFVNNEIELALRGYYT
ncbi:hypothetical protein EIK77_000028 [Talaromyces pinophilus]|nr:hypothetical protein EIK77_000028 [Talaromyces pinophilus]